MDIYSDQSFDFIYCCHVLEHIPDDQKAVKEIYRILTKKGWAIFMVPIFPSLKETYEDPSIVKEEERWQHFGQGDHVRLYAKKPFVQLLKGSGFQVDQLGIEYFGEELFQKSALSKTSVLYIAKK
jgi:ubiquinone/menaquinone biosynthesis C-methylase UbiE